MAGEAEASGEAARPAAVGQLNDYACGGESMMSKWLDDASVQAALHVTSSGSMRYKQSAGDLRPVYEKLVQK